MDSKIQVVWSNKERITYLKVLDYLSRNWTNKEIVQFAKRTEVVIHATCKNPEIFSASMNHKDIRRAIIDKNNSFFYKVNSYNQKIYLLTFYDNRQDPPKLTF
ncbi:MAG: hypothetical protein A2W90_16555 [Bacteroidetes bacterium GWF2_42_66]|nr:MAG: hypothetical protein A2W92_04060 [Bacteroidetes bacterium GWA2_42_15]OFX96305.1 MAG: hypothetical protein A2W89_05485 [Bacteroidetes bacterium GWE2_42_39]OFY46344.1 MAG: hypothetical protein A2W90_16555 [Bacteroidetes bacterium GWF2_42_66]HAZ03466.1 hypothetical protein [Marinilabiliales bacterium]HBL78270.1 hypothetical protein [Prolixibacteraceae bacterium]